MAQLTAAEYQTLFGRLGQIIKAINSYLVLQGTTLVADLDAIATPYDSTNPERRDLIVGLVEAYDGFESGAASWISSLLQYSDGTLADLQQSLNADSTSTASILDLLILDMNDTIAPRSAAQTVNASTVSAPSIADADSPTGTGTILMDTTVDGTLVDERAINEVVMARCTADESTGVTAGNETFSLIGYPAQDPTNGVEDRGNGNGPTIVTAAANGASTGGPNLIPYGDFENWSGSPLAPDGWTIVTGTAATHIVRNATPYTGTYSLSLVAAATPTDIQITQDLSEILQPNTMYCASILVRKVGAAAGGTLTIRIAGGVLDEDLFSANPSTLTTSYAVKHVYFYTGNQSLVGAIMDIIWEDADTAGVGDTVLIDELTIQPATNFGNTWYAAIRGDTDFLLDDRFRITTANDYGGVIQTFFGRFYGTLLPSNNAGGETIDDNLAT
jgi:hypothetical protein